MLELLKYFELLIQLLELDVDVDSYMKLAIYIKDNPDKNYKFLHRHAFLFQSFLDLVLGKIDAEEFIMVGDVESKIPLYNLENDSVHAKLELIKDSVVIIDSFVLNIYKNSDLEKKLISNNIEVLAC